MMLRPLPFFFLLLMWAGLTGCTLTPTKIPEAIPVATEPAQKSCACPVNKRIPVATRAVSRSQITPAVYKPTIRRQQAIPTVARATPHNQAKALVANYTASQRSAFGPPLSYAVSRNNKVLVNQLLDNGASIEAVDPMDHSPLAQAIVEKNPSMVDLLLQRGADLAGDVPPYGKPLVAAIEVNSPEVVKVLLKHGVNKDSARFHWRRPLDIAREKGNPAIIALLEKVNASSANDDFERESAEMKLLERTSHIR